jgi:long-chain fatty acid transport protein
LRKLISLLLGLGIVLSFNVAQAGGFFLTPPGAHALARGGAYVAGAEGAGSFAFNPAGLVFGERGLLFSGVLPIQSTDFERVATDPATGTQITFPSVKGQGFSLLSPTIAGVFSFDGLPDLALGGAVIADVPGLQNWPDHGPDGGPSAQRYSVLSFDGSILVKTVLGAAYKVTPWLSLGFAGNLLVGSFSTTTVLSACDGINCVQPENPDFDVKSRLRVPKLVVPGAQIGITLAPTKWFRLGFAWESGYDINASGTVDLVLPSGALFADAKLEPAEPVVSMQMRLPMKFRVGFEFRLQDVLQIEVAGSFEQWSVHEEIKVAMDAKMVDVALLGEYNLQEFSIQRGFRDVWSLRLGGEWMPLLGDERPLAVRMGVMYEPSAVPKKYLNPMATDFDKIISSIGGRWRFGSISLEAGYSLVWMPEVTVQNSVLKQVNPTRPPYPGATVVANGVYQSRAHVIAFGARYSL